MKYLAAGLCAVLAAMPAAAQRTDQNVLMSDHPPIRSFQDQYGYSDAVIAGDLIFLSGIVVGQAPGETDLKPGYERAYSVIGRILKRAGAGYDDIVEITSFHTDIKAEIDDLAAVQKKYLKSPYPAWTAIDIDRLLPDNGVTEIKIIARRPAKAD